MAQTSTIQHKKFILKRFDGEDFNLYNAALNYKSVYQQDFHNHAKFNVSQLRSISVDPKFKQQDSIVPMNRKRPVQTIFQQIPKINTKNLHQFSSIDQVQRAQSLKNHNEIQQNIQSNQKAKTIEQPITTKLKSSSIIDDDSSIRLSSAITSQTDKSIFGDEIDALDWEIVRSFIGDQFFNNKDFNIEQFVIENEQFLKSLLQNIAAIKKNLQNTKTQLTQPQTTYDRHFVKKEGNDSNNQNFKSEINYETLSKLQSVMTKYDKQYESSYQKGLNTNNKNFTDFKINVPDQRISTFDNNQLSSFLGHSKYKEDYINFGPSTFEGPFMPISNELNPQLVYNSTSAYQKQFKDPAQQTTQFTKIEIDRYHDQNNLLPSIYPPQSMYGANFQPKPHGYLSNPVQIEKKNPEFQSIEGFNGQYISQMANANETMQELKNEQQKKIKIKKWQRKLTEKLKNVKQMAENESERRIKNLMEAAREFKKNANQDQ